MPGIVESQWDDPVTDTDVVALAEVALAACDVGAARVSRHDHPRSWFASEPGAAITEPELAALQNARRSAVRRRAVGELGAADLKGSRIGCFAIVALVDNGGELFGTLAVADRAERRLRAVQRAALTSLGRLVASRLQTPDLAAAALSAERKLAEVQRVARIGTWVCHLDTGRVELSDGLHALVGLDRAGFAGTRAAFLELVHPEDRPSVAARIDRAASFANDVQFDCRVVGPDGATIWLHCRGVAEADAAGTAARIRGTAADVTDRVALQEELAALALVDELTGLHNRRSLVALAEQQRRMAARQGRRLRLVFVDVDGMKHINDSYGHQAGDLALIEVARALRSTFRSSDVVARLGGDEFCVLLVDEPGQASGDIEHRLAALRAVAPRADRPYEISLSVGVAHLDPAADDTVEDVVGRADQAMYADKAQARRLPRVLVVEDDSGLRRLAELSLRPRYDVQAAATGEEALRRLDAQLPDLILLDLGLPGISGADVVHELRRRPGGTKVPVIVVTAAGGRHTELDSLRDGVDDFVVKPVDLEILEARMETVLRRSLARGHRRGP